MANLKMCNCQYCKRGRKKHGNKKMIRSMRRANRQKTKLFLRQGKYDKVENEVAVPYTS